MGSSHTFSVFIHEQNKRVCMGFSNPRWPPCKYSIHLLFIQDSSHIHHRHHHHLHIHYHHITYSLAHMHTHTHSLTHSLLLLTQSRLFSAFNKNAKRNFSYLTKQTRRDRQPQPCEKTAHPASTEDLGPVSPISLGGKVGSVTQRT